jgi:uroporphyrinogen decarboxylase
MKMSNRERFKAIARFQRPGDLFIVETFWPDVFPNWVRQGAPEQIIPKVSSVSGVDLFLREYFKLDDKKLISEVHSGWASGKEVDIGHNIRTVDGGILVPGYESKVISEDERTITYANGTGQTLKVLKNKAFTMPMFLDWPVKDRASWKKHKKMLDPNNLGRWPTDWKAYVQELNSHNDPVVLQVGGFFGLLREWVGSEKILYMFYDDPDLIEDMMDQILYLETEIIKRVVKDITIDEVDFCEDVAYKAGPLISPNMVKKFMVPRYKKIIDLCHAHDIDIIYVDCDGNIEQLIPLWLEAGINYVWPLEQTAGNDVVSFRKKYGKDLILGGGIDKRALLKGKEAIRKEIMSKVPFLLEGGGYFPSVDHYVAPDVTLDNYRYYINTLREVAGLEVLSFE